MGAMARLPGFLAIMVTLVSISFIERTFGPLIPLYVQHLHAPDRLLGTISGAVITTGSVAAAIAATTMGRLSRGRNPRNLLLVTLAGGCLVLVPIALARQWWQLLLLRPMLDLFIGGNTTLAYAIAARALPEQWKLTAFGTLGGLAQIGNALAPFVAGAVTDAVAQSADDLRDGRGAVRGAARLGVEVHPCCPPKTSRRHPSPPAPYRPAARRSIPRSANTVKMSG